MTDPVKQGVAFLDKLSNTERRAYLGLFAGARSAKMSAMIRKGLVEGCACGCRGDFQLPTRVEP